MAITSKTCIVCGVTKALGDYRRGGYGTRKCKACERDLFLKSKQTSAAYVDRECVSCGASFRVLSSQLNSGRRSGLHCSHECRKRLVPLECACCKRTYTVMPCMVGKRKYCSQACAGVERRPPETWTETFLLRQHHTSRQWNETSQRIIARDGYACTECGSEVDLVVHHIVSWRISRDDSPENLITLCRTCHSHKHRAEDGRIVRRVTSRL